MRTINAVIQYKPVEIHSDFNYRAFVDSPNKGFFGLINWRNNHIKSRTFNDDTKTATYIFEYVNKDNNVTANVKLNIKIDINVDYEPNGFFADYDSDMQGNYIRFYGYKIGNKKGNDYLETTSLILSKVRKIRDEIIHKKQYQ